MPQSEPGSPVKVLCADDPFSICFLHQAYFLSEFNTTVVTGFRVMDYIRNVVLALNPNTSHCVVNDWTKASRNLQLLQRTVILNNGTVFGSDDNVRQYGPLKALIIKTKREQVARCKR